MAGNTREERINQAVRNERATTFNRDIAEKLEEQRRQHQKQKFSGQIGGQFDHRGTLHVVELHTVENRHYTQEMLRFALEPDEYDKQVRYKLTKSEIFGGPGEWPLKRWSFDYVSKDLWDQAQRLLNYQSETLSAQRREIHQFKSSWLGRIYLWLNKTK